MRGQTFVYSYGTSTNQYVQINIICLAGVEYRCDFLSSETLWILWKTVDPILAELTSLNRSCHQQHGPKQPVAFYTKEVEL